jgi:hypothetical protein
MPTGPQSQKRPADVIGAAIKIARIATGEIEDEAKDASGRAKSSRAGGSARAKRLDAEQRREIAKKAAAARWEKVE